MKPIYFSFLLFLTFACNFSTDSTAKVEKEPRWWAAADQQFIISELDRTTNELLDEVRELTEEQWGFRADSTHWSIGDIIEHLEMQNQLHFREISVTSKAPQYEKFRAITSGQDGFFTRYAVDTTKGKAQWFLEPLGRFPTKEMGVNAFLRARGGLKKFVEETNIDLRKQFTFRVPVEGLSLNQIKIGQVRDLHQLLLTGIAHTDRHIRQIEKIKLQEDFPK